MVFEAAAWAARFTVALLPLLQAEGGLSVVGDPEQFGGLVRAALAFAGPVD
jgi:hypothetical protein